MHAVDETNVDRIDVSAGKKLLIIRADRGNIVFFCQVHSLFPAVFPRPDGLELDFFHILQRGKNLFDNLARSQYSQTHKITFLI